MANILIVDDDARMCEAIRTQLKADGHTCVSEPTAERAVQAINSTAPDLLILDVMLPGVSGFELCRKIRANAELYSLPIILISAMTDSEEIDHGLAQGADDYVTKPFNMRDLAKRVERLLASNSQERLVDEQTALPGPHDMKLRIQRAISRRNTFSLAYVELGGIQEFAKRNGAEARAKALRHFARCLHLCGKEMEAQFYAVGHMGGGHFVCMMEPQAAERYCQLIQEMWQKHVPKLSSTLDIKLVTDRPVDLNVLICVTTREANSNISFRELFETLSHLRQNALSGSAAQGIYIDRRG
ncbi:MAG: response regulator [Candidatus Hydrogenedentes bacterium]|nr:response regulator [Candidatus Hydrogenedentota bacterium]